MISTRPLDAMLCPQAGRFCFTELPDIDRHHTHQDNLSKLWAWIHMVDAVSCTHATVFTVTTQSLHFSLFTVFHLYRFFFSFRTGHLWGEEDEAFARTGWGGRGFRQDGVRRTRRLPGAERTGCLPGSREGMSSTDSFLASHWLDVKYLFFFYHSLLRVQAMALTWSFNGLAQSQ